MTKRLFDLAISGIALALLGPLLVVVALWVKLDSKGPVLFRQERVGQFGHAFRIFKFRTMFQDGDVVGASITVGGDPRITRAGRVLRRSKIDELPQLLNVLRGDMSLVGPRPEVPKYVALYPDLVRTRVLSVRPGITDDAAIQFRDEEQILASADDPERYYVSEVLPRKLAMYERYVQRHSVAGDLRVLYRTLLSLVVRK